MKVLLAALLLVIGWSACTPTESVSSSQVDGDPMLEDYYLNIKGAAPRLSALMTGTFSCYSVRKKGLWAVNGGKDSLLLHGCTLGEPAKDGYWVYNEIIMTHLPEDPLVQRVYKIEQISPDSLKMRNYRILDKKKMAGIYKKNNRPLNEDNLRETTCGRKVVKAEQVVYWAASSACHEKKKEKDTWTDAYYTYQPQKIRQETLTWPHEHKRDTNKIDNHTILYFKRLPARK